MILVQPAFCAAGDILFSDDFEDGTLSPWTAYDDPDRVGVSNATAHSGEYSMYVRWGYDAGDSPEFDANVPAATLNVWIRRGDEAFSEDPDTDEDLHIQYVNASGNWQDLDVLPGDGSPGEIFTPTYTLPSNARHSDLRIGFWLDSGSGEDYDYWHMDDVIVTERSLDSFCSSGATIHDSFEDGNLDPWKVQTTGGSDGEAGVSQDTAAYGSYSAFVSSGEVSVRTKNIDLSRVSSANLSLWIRRGDDAFSEDPDSGEDLVLEYKAPTGNTWNELRTYSGEGEPGEIFTPSFPLPENALHNNFRLRLRLTGGSGPGYDYWHFDNVCLTTVGGGDADHYAISHDETAVSCASEPITITAHNPGHNPVDPGNISIQIEAINQNTGNGEGTWARIINGSGTLSDPTAGDGSASYTFPGGESSVTLAFNYTDVTNATDPETVNFDINGGNEGTGEDPDLTVSRSGFRITDGNGNPIEIPDQIAGKRTDQAPNNQTLGLQAVKTSNNDPSQCEPAFPDGTEVEVELAAECRDPVTCAGNQMRVINPSSNQTIATNDDNGGNGAASYTLVPLLFGTNAEASIQLKYNDAGKMQFHARYNPIKDGSGDPPLVEYITGSSNQHVWRPFGFYLDFDTNDDGSFNDRASTSDCSSQTSCALNASSDIFVTAGTDFPVKLEAVIWTSTDDSNQDGVPDSNQEIKDNAPTPNFGQETTAETVDLRHELVAPSGGDTGNLSGGQNISGFSNGNTTASSVSWNEVGIIDLNASLSEQPYLGSGPVTGSAPNVGRFIPAYFQLASNSPFFEPFCNGFTYLDQRFYYSDAPIITLTAQNANNSTTQNYGGEFWQYQNKNDYLANRTYTDQANASAFLNATRLDNATVQGETDFDGSWKFVLHDYYNSTADGDEFQYEKNGTEEPFNANVDINLHEADLTDRDGICYEVNGSCSGYTLENITGTELRYGRLALESAYGSELLNLEVPIRAQYFRSGGFIANKQDQCTQLTLGNGNNTVEMELKNEDIGWQAANKTIDLAGNQASGSTQGLTLQKDGYNATSLTLGNGTASLVLEAPGANNTGYVHVRANLEDHPWLQHDWSGNGNYTDNPNATATFGIFKGNEHIIHQQESTWK